MMRFGLWLLAAACFALAGCSSQTLSSIVAPSIETMGPDELKQLVDSGKNFVFLDVRDADEIEQRGTLKNYLHIPLAELESRLNEVPPNVPVIAACNKGVRAGRAAVFLVKQGYKDVKSVGLAEYKARGYELIYPKRGSNRIQPKTSVTR